MGDRLGIIAGSGDFPLLAAAEARRMGLEALVAAIRDETDPGITELASGIEWFDVDDLTGAAAGVAAFLTGRGVHDVILAGKIRPEKVIGGTVGSPVPILAGLIRFLESRGLRVADPTPFLASFFCPPGMLTRTAAGPGVFEDVAYGFRIARLLADADIGQTVVVKNRMTVAVEGIEGTDKAILRAGELAGPGTVAVKVSRSNQDPRIDLPAVGLGTVRALAAAGGSALAIEARRVPFFGREEAVALAESRGITLLAVEEPAPGSDSRRSS